MSLKLVENDGTQLRTDTVLPEIVNWTLGYIVFMASPPLLSMRRQNCASTQPID